MTTQELNRDIKRLFKSYYGRLDESKEATKEFYEWMEKDIKPEFKRLYYADSSFESLNRENILRMVRLNLSLRVFPLHSFGLSIKEASLM